MKYSKNKICGEYVFFYNNMYYALSYNEMLPILEYRSNSSLTKEFIKSKYGLSQYVFNNRLLITGNEDNRRKMVIDKTIFHTIETEEQAYWLGFITADGYINEDKYYLRLALQESDKHHLEKFCDFLNIGHNYIKLHDKATQTYHVEIFGKNLISDLKQYGLFQRKSLKEVYYDFNNERLQIAYIRGLIDGDGSITKKSLSLVGSENIVLCVRNYFDKIVHFNLDYIYRDRQLYVFKIQKQELIKLIANKIYSNATIYLDRKYNIFLEYYKGENYE